MCVFFFSEISSLKYTYSLFFFLLSFDASLIECAILVTDDSFADSAINWTWLHVDMVLNTLHLFQCVPLKKKQKLNSRGWRHEVNEDKIERHNEKSGTMIIIYFFFFLQFNIMEKKSHLISSGRAFVAYTIGLCDDLWVMIRFALKEKKKICIWTESRCHSFDRYEHTILTTSLH